jgi:predicted amidohydrolase YtcJ
MRQKFFIICLLVLLYPSVGLSQQIPPLVAEQGYADMVLVNGKIATKDDRSTTPNTPGNIVQAMAIKGERIMALGSDSQMRQLAGPNTRFVDVQGRTVIPGLIQTHYHSYGSHARTYGPQMGLVDPSVKLIVVAETTAEATAKKVRDTVVNAIRVQQLPEGQWITIDLQENEKNRRGTTFTWLYLGKINRRHFDSGTEDNPVLLRTQLQGIFNSRAVEEFTSVFPDWEESTDWENGPGSGLNGYAAVPDRGALTFEFWWKDKPLEDLAEVLRLGGVDIVNKGITTLSTRILYPRVVAAYHQLNREGRMPHRLAYYIESQRGNLWNLKTTREFYKGTGAPWTTHSAGDEMLWLGGMCNEVWDSIYNEVCLGPDVDAPDDIQVRERCPEPGTKPYESVKTALIHGWRPVQVHATSSHGGRLYLQMVEEAMEEGNLSVEYIRNLRMTLEHNPLLGNVPEVMEGIKKYGIILNVKPDHIADTRENIRDYGEQILKFVAPVKSWIDQGVRVTFEANGTDFWTPMYELVTRNFGMQRGSEDRAPLIPGEAIDRVTAMKMATTWASEYMLAEDTIGTLEPGKFADFTVLDRDFFTIPIEEVRQLEAVMTGLGGEIVYDPGQIASGN